MLLFSCSQVFCRYIYDTVGIDIKGNLDLRNATSCRRDSIQTELSKGFVVFRELTLTLYNVDVYSGLIVCCCGEDLALFGRDRCITLDQTGCNTSHCLDGQGQRSNVQQQDIACAFITSQFTTLYRCSKSYTLIRVQALARLMSGQLFYFLLYCRDTCGTTYQQDFSKFGSVQACIRQSSLYRLSSLLYQVMGQFIEFCFCQVHIQMLRSICCCCDERKVDVCCGRAGQLFLSFLSCLTDTLHSHLVIGQIYTFLFLELGQDVVSYLLVEVVAAQTVVSCGGKNFDHSVADLDDGNIEGTAAQVVYHDLLLFLIVKAVSQGCRCRLVDDTFYIQACNLSCVFGCLTLSVIEVSRNSDNCFCYFLAQIVLCIAFQLLQDHSGNLLRRIFLSFNIYFVIGTHLTFDGTDRSLSVGDCLTFCRLTYETLTVFGECHDRRCGSLALCVCDNGRFSTFHNCYTAVCCTKVNTNNLAHDFFLLNHLSFQWLFVNKYTSWLLLPCCGEPRCLCICSLSGIPRR